jgi:DNA-binding MurR/RpiR family transcriptional regulator
MDRDYIDVINDVYPSLSQAEKRVADYTLENLTIVLRMSTRELCDVTNVSEPTVFRFCQQLGFSGFRDFKISMAQQVATYKNYFTSNDISESKLQTLVRRALQTEIKVIDTTLKMMDYALLEKTAGRMLSARRICLFGAGSSVESCNDARRKFARLGMNVWSFSDFHEAATTLGTFNEQDMLIAVSHSGITRETTDVLRIAFDRKAHTVLITAFPNTHMRKYVHTILRTYAQETVDNRIVIASRIGQFAMIDALYMAVVSTIGDDVLPMMEQTTHDVMGRESI